MIAHLQLCPPFCALDALFRVSIRLNCGCSIIWCYVY